MGKLRLLSIDGGGIRGVIPARILAYLERRTGKPISHLFDAVAGTSTGAIIALSLVRPKAALGDAEKLESFYSTYAPQIFQEPWADRAFGMPRWMSKLFGMPQGYDFNDLWRPRYQALGRQDVLTEHFGGQRMSSCALPVFVTAYDTELRCPVCFVSRAEHEANTEYYEATSATSLVDAAMASTAAPTYFPPHSMLRIHGGRYSVIDGGLFANNPTALALGHFGGDKDALVLSLGTGSMQLAYPYETTKEWGTLRWAGPMLRMVLDGQSESTHLALERAHPKGQYLRLQGLVYDTGVTEDLDDYRASNLTAAKVLADQIILENQARIDAFCDRLLALGPTEAEGDA